MTTGNNDTMRGVLARVDDILGRIPPDSIYGRAVKQEIIDHLGDAIADKISARGGVDPTILQQAIAQSVDDFGAPEPLERNYYRDYLAARYWLGLFDREVFARSDRLLLRGGAAMLQLGLILGLLIPTIAAYAAAVGLASAQVNLELEAAQGLGAHLGTAIDDAILFSLPYELRQGPWLVFAGLGMLAFSVGALWVLFRSRIVAPRNGRIVLVFLAVPVVGLAFAISAGPDTFAEGLAAALLWGTDYQRAAQPLETARLLALGLIAALTIASVVIVWTARAQARADSIGLRQAGVGLAMLGLGSLSVAHPVLLRTLHAMTQGDVAPAQIVGALHQDLLLFVMGILLIAVGLVRLRRVADEMHSTCISRGGNSK